MRNIYLEVLGLQPGASKADIKKAYRILSKKYHPDISKVENAKEKFIELAAAYEFLTKVGPTPNHEPIAYDYDPQQDAYRKWRAEAARKARKRAHDAELRQKKLIRSILSVYDNLARVIILFNLLLILDYVLPKTQIPVEFDQEKKIIANREAHSSYVPVVFENHVINLKTEALADMMHGTDLRLDLTLIWRKPFGVHFHKDFGNWGYHKGFFDVFHAYGFLIIVLAVFFFLYHFVMTYLDQKLGMAIAIFVAFVGQVIVFFIT